MPNETATLPGDDNIPLEEVVASLRAENEELWDRIFLQGGDLDTANGRIAVLTSELREARGEHEPKPFPCVVYQGREDERG